MIGIGLAILSAIFQSFKEISIKNNLKDLNSNSLIFLLSGASIFFWLPFVLYIGIPELTIKFWIVFFVSGSLFYIGKIFNFKAIQSEDISYIAPLKGLISVGVVILSIFLLGEIPSLLGLLGVISILVGTYLLNVTSYHKRFIDPILHIFKNKGSRYFLVTIVCYSITFVLDKIGVLESYPIFWIFMMNLFLFVSSIKGFIPKYKKQKTIITKNFKYIVLTFVLYALSHFTQMEAIKLIFAGYLSAIKISSMLFTIVLGGLFFKENNIRNKLYIGILIVLGVILIMLG